MTFPMGLVEITIMFCNFNTFHVEFDYALDIGLTTLVHND